MNENKKIEDENSVNNAELSQQEDQIEEISAEDVKSETVEIKDENPTNNASLDDLNSLDQEGEDLDDSTRDLNAALRVENKKDIDRKKTIVSFEDVSLSFDEEVVIDRLNLEIQEGDFVYFVGPSGAGKSSLAKMVYREIKPTTGNIYVDGENIVNLKSNKMPYLRRKIGVIFQDYKLLKDKTIYENVRYSLDVTGYEKSKREEQVLKTLERVGLLEHKDKYPNELSGGQQQRVAIARAIVDDPKIIVADEPTGNLDPENALQIMEILMNINKTGTTFIMATHDVGIVNIFKNRVVLVKDGKVANEVEGEYIYE